MLTEEKLITCFRSSKEFTTLYSNMTHLIMFTFLKINPPCYKIIKILMKFIELELTNIYMRSNMHYVKTAQESGIYVNRIIKISVLIP